MCDAYYRNIKSLKIHNKSTDLGVFVLHARNGSQQIDTPRSYSELNNNVRHTKISRSEISQRGTKPFQRSNWDLR